MISAAVFLLAALEVTRASLVLEELHGVPSFIVPYSIFVLLLGIAEWPRDQRAGPAVIVPLLLLSVYGVVRLCGVLYADDSSVVWAGTQSYLKEVLAVAAIVIVVRTPDRLRAAVWGVIVAGLVLAVLGVWQHLTGSWGTGFGGFARAVLEEGTGRWRIGGPVADPNFFAQTMVLVAALGVERAWHEHRIVLRLAAATTAVLSITVVVFTGSRGGWLGLVAVTAVLAWRARPLPSTIGAVALALAVVVAVAPSDYRQRAASLGGVVGSSEDDDYSLNRRSRELEVGVAMFLDHPAVGVGFGHHLTHFLDHARELDIETPREQRSAHSVPLEVAAESGLVGLVTFGAIPVAAVLATGRARRRLAHSGHDDDAGLVAGLQAGTAGLLVTALFLPLSTPQAFWLVIGLCFAAQSVADGVTVRTGRAVPKGV